MVRAARGHGPGSRRLDESSRFHQADEGGLKRDDPGIYGEIQERGPRAIQNAQWREGRRTCRDATESKGGVMIRSPQYTKGQGGIGDQGYKRADA